MRMNRCLTLGAVLALLLGLTACNKNRINEPIPTSDTDTYVGVSIKFPQPTTRALPEDYNKIKDGEWNGRDKIQTIKVYVVTNDAVINSTKFTESAFNTISDGVLSPNLAVEAKAGEKVKAYVVINDVNAKVTTALDALGAAEFDQKFAETVAQVAAIGDVAKTQVAGSGSYEDIVVMTNKIKPTELNVEANISKKDAIAGKNNRIDIEVTRVASRGIVTMTEDSEKQKLDIINKVTTIDRGAGTTKVEDKKTATVTITDVSYEVTAGALQFNVLEDATTWKVPTPVYDFMPKATWGETRTQAAEKLYFPEDSKYDWKTVIKKADNSADNLKAALGEEQFSKFVLPVTHADEKYRKGNTTMFEIKANFKVKNNTDEFPDAEDLTDHSGDLFYGLTDGLFYSTKEKAEAMDKNADSGTPKKQEVKEYKNGEMYYYIWLNPDVKYEDLSQKITKSPTVRNQVYHAHITGFKEMGLTSKEELDPNEELETDKTHISVQLKVVPWTMHSYTVELGNRY